MVICIVWIAFILSQQKKKLEFNKTVCANKDFSYVIMPIEDTKILEFNQNQRSIKVTFIIYANLECTLEKTDGCKNNSENSYATRVSEHIVSGFPMSAIFLFRNIKNKHYLYRGKDYIKKFCEFLTVEAIKIISFKKKKMKSITK